MQCVVLAGGLGTRMRRWTDERPKVLIPVHGRPFAEWQLEWLVAQGVSDVVFSVGYRADMVRAALGDGSRCGVAIRYVDEGSLLRGTAGALRLAAEQGVLDPSFFVLYGDSFLTVDLPRVWAAFVECRRPALMTVLRNDGQWDRSNAVYRDGVVELYDKGGPASAEMVYIDYGLSVLTLGAVERYVAAGANGDLAAVYHQLSAAGELAGYEVRDRFYEIGSEEGLSALEAALSGGPLVAAPEGMRRP